MGHWSSRLAGANTALATLAAAGTVPAQLVPANVGNRVRLDLYPTTGGIQVAYGATAGASTAFNTLPSGVWVQERDWNGYVSAVAAGGSAALFVRELTT